MAWNKVLLSVLGLAILLGCQIPFASAQADVVCNFAVAQGQAMVLQGEEQSAIQTWKQAFQQDRQCWQALTAMAAWHVSNRQWKQAEKAYARALRAQPKSVTLHFRLAEVYLAREKHVWAQRTLRKAETLLVDSQRSRYHYLLGLAALGLQDPMTAESHFKKVPQMAKSELPLIDYYLGLAQLQQKDNVHARRSLTNYIDRPGSPNAFSDSAQRMLQMAYDGPQRYPLISVAGAISLLYESNVIQQPDDPASESGQSPDSFGTSLRLKLGVYPLRKARHLLGADLSLSRTFYYEDPADDFSSWTLLVSPRYRLRFIGGGLDQEIQVGYSGSLVGLDGGTMAEEPDTYVYSESHSGWLRYAVTEGELGESTTQTSLKVSAGRGFYHHRGRDNTFGRATLGQSFFFLDERLKLFLEAHGRYENARRADYDRWGVGPFAGLSGLVVDGVSLVGWMRYEYLNNHHSDDSQNWPEARRDHLLSGGASLSYTPTANFDLSVSYDATHNRSTVDLYQYTQHRVMLTFTGKGAW